MYLLNSEPPKTVSCIDDRIEVSHLKSANFYWRRGPAIWSLAWVVDVLGTLAKTWTPNIIQHKNTQRTTTST